MWRFVLSAGVLLGLASFCRADSGADRLARAQADRQAGDLVAAETQIQALIDDPAGSDRPASFRAALHREMGEVLLQQERLHDAVLHFERSLVETSLVETSLGAEPGQAIVHYKAGLARRGLGDNAAAARHLERAVEQGFRNTGVLFHLVHAHFAAGEKAAGLLRAREILALELGSGDLPLRLGRLLFQHLFYTDALLAFESALAKSPESYEIRFYAALTNYLLNRHEQAVLILAPMAGGGGTVEAWNLLASAYAQQDQFGKAEALFRKAVELRPRSPHAYLNFAFVLMEQGKMKRAEAQLEKLRLLETSESPKAFYTVRRNSCAEVEQQMRAATGIAPGAGDPVRAQAFFDLATMLSDRYHHGTVVEVLRIAQRYEGSSSRLLHRLALSCLNLDPQSTAPLQLLERVVEMEPERGESHHSLGRAYHLLGTAYLGQRKPALAISALRTAVELRPGNSASHADFGRALVAAEEVGEENTAEAEKAFARAVEIDPDNVIARYGLAKLMMGQGRHADVVSLLAEAVEREPEFYEPYYILGQAHARLKNPAEAKRNLDLFLVKKEAAEARSTVGAGFVDATQ